ncbi:hypothetical protein K6969_02195 [Streptococcus suis]|uniref:hypothetical protein n=1 Tax=Streptococcus suis TaxID=1307 RepID=UPI000407D4B7|nr:hypothetical protein [Streptococcus suis]QZT29745.1 hypothetical protein K6969_02195 [Streptococcus suis]HEM3165386.1 hypothetical protein [Streptococcus suis 92-1191]HEM6182509.1 hypothetical protein [Streptococcus suis]
MDNVKRQDSLFVESVTVALLELMSEKEFSTLTVSELTKRQVWISHICLSH